MKNSTLLIRILATLFLVLFLAVFFQLVSKGHLHEINISKLEQKYELEKIEIIKKYKEDDVLVVIFKGNRNNEMRYGYEIYEMSRYNRYDFVRSGTSVYSFSAFYEEINNKSYIIITGKNDKIFNTGKTFIHHKYENRGSITTEVLEISYKIPDIITQLSQTEIGRYALM